MKLYKENGTSPFGACLPSLLQMPFLIVLYSLIRGLSNVVPKGRHIRTPLDAQSSACKRWMRAPRYIPTDSQMHQALGGQSWPNALVVRDGFVVPSAVASRASLGSASQAVLVLPYLVLIGAAMFLQYYQMKQMNSRNPQAAAANPQMQTMQKFFPIIFGVIYLRVPAGATIYMVVSSAMRIGTQEVMFRTGMVTPVAAEREIGSAKEDKAKENKEKPPPPEAGQEEDVDGDGRDGGRQGDAAAGEEREPRRQDQRAGADEREEAGRGEADDERQGGERRQRRRCPGTEGPPAVALEADQKGSITRGVG